VAFSTIVLASTCAFKRVCSACCNFINISLLACSDSAISSAIYFLLFSKEVCVGLHTNHIIMINKKVQAKMCVKKTHKFGNKSLITSVLLIGVQAVKQNKHKKRSNRELHIKNILFLILF
jgi:hypothetical protein